MVEHEQVPVAAEILDGEPPQRDRTQRAVVLQVWIDAEEVREAFVGERGEQGSVATPDIDDAS